MGFLFAFLAIIGETAAKTVDRFNYRDNKIGVSQQMLLTFFGMTVALAAFVAIARPPLPSELYISLGLLSLVAIVSFVGNVFDEMSLKVNDLSLRQPVTSFAPIMTGFIGFLLFPLERKTSTLIALVVATAVVYYGTSPGVLRKVEKKGIVFLVLAVVTYSFLPSIFKATLDYVDPAYIALFRTTAILLLTSLVFRKIKQRYTVPRVRLGLLAGALYAATTLFDLYAIKHLGVVQTVLFWLLGSGLIYLTSYFLLKEKVRRQEVIASVLLAVIAAVALLL